MLLEEVKEEPADDVEVKEEPHDDVEVKEEDPCDDVEVKEEPHHEDDDGDVELEEPTADDQEFWYQVHV